MRNAVNTWLGENASAVETRPLRQIVSQWIAHAWSSITEDIMLNTESEVPTQLVDDMSTSVDYDKSSVDLLALPSNKTTTTQLQEQSARSITASLTRKTTDKMIF